MLELTDDQKEECQKMINALMSYWWRKIEVRIDKGLSFQAALQELKQEMRNDRR